MLSVSPGFQVTDRYKKVDGNIMVVYFVQAAQE